MAQTVPFTKGHGTGNDFVIVADPGGELDLTADQIAALCDRHRGIGADGILRVVRTSAVAADPSAPDAAQLAGAEWFMDYRNADGSLAEMCGNGIRVFLRYLLDAGLASLGDEETIRIGTRNGVLPMTRSDLGFEVDLGAFRIEEGDVLVRARGIPVPRPGLGVDVGNPHVVVALPTREDLEDVDLTVPPQLQPAPPRGANVEFVVPAPLRAAGGETVGSIRMRVFERGVGETLSCGTGVAASALAVREWAGQGAPDRWVVEVPGGTLGVRVAPVDGIPHVFLSGPATLVFSGEVSLA